MLMQHMNARKIVTFNTLKVEGEKVKRIHSDCHLPFTWRPL